MKKIISTNNTHTTLKPPTVRLKMLIIQYLLYLPTQIPFLIGGEGVTCHWSKLDDVLGRAKLTDALGEQHLELWTCT